jgi:hypothetical protein
VFALYDGEITKEKKMQIISIFGRNLIFGERHDEPLLRQFLIDHLAEFSQQGYHLLVVEVSANLPIGDQIDPMFPAETPVQQVMDTAHKLVSTKDGKAAGLLDNIATNIQYVLASKSHKESFGLLLKCALVAGFSICCLDPADDPTYDAKRVKSYDSYVAPRLDKLDQKWLCLVGDDHVEGLVKEVKCQVAGFRHANLKVALEAKKLQTIAGLETVQPITN